MKIKIFKDLIIEIDEYEILGIKYKILEVDEVDDDNNSGEVNLSNRVIKIKKLTNDNLENLLHEFNHCSLDESGQSEGLHEKKEEDLCQLFARQNKYHLRYILKKVSPIIARRAIEGYKKAEQEKKNKRRGKRAKKT